MKKNLLLSLVAASAPMMAFADANVPVNTDKGAKGWVNDGGSAHEIGTADVLSSNGPHITREIELVPGIYKLAVGNGSDNAQAVLARNQNWASNDAGLITADKPAANVKLLKDGSYEVTATTKVWLRVCRIDEKKNVLKANGVSVTLVYDFEAAAKTLDDEAVFDLGKVDKVKYPAIVEKLENRATLIKGDILEMKEMNGKLADDQKNKTQVAYDYYKKNSLWNGVESLQLWSDIQTLKKDIDDAGKVTNTHAYAIQERDAVVAALEAVSFKEAGDKADNAYAKTTKGYDNERKALIEAVKKSFEGVDAYETDPNYTTTFSKANVDKICGEYTKAETGKIDVLQKKINDAIADDKAYNDFDQQVKEVNTKYLAKQKELTGLMNANEGQKENVYEGLLKQATVKLADASRLVTNTAFNNKLGTKDLHDSAKENSVYLQGEIDKANAAIDKTVSDYTTWYNDEVAAYTAQMAVVKAKNDLLVPYNKDTEETKTLRKTAADAIADFQQVLVDQNKVWNLAKYAEGEEYKAKVADIDAKIKAYTDKVGLDKANFKNYTTLVNNLAALDKKLAEAKAAVANMKYDKDGYKYNGAVQNNTLAIDGTEKGKEGSLTKAKAKVGDAYNAKTTYDVAWVNVTAIEGDITSYQSTAQASFDKYKEVVGNLAADKKATAELRTLVGDDGFVTNADKKTYDAIVKEVQANIDAAAKPLADAMAKQNVAHQNALNSVYSSQKDAIAGHKTQFATDKAEYIKNTNIQDAIQLRDAAQAIVKDINGTVAELKTKIGGTGTKKSEFETELKKIEDEVAKHQTILDSYKVIDEKNSLEASAELGKVQKATAELQTQINQLETKVDAQIEVVKAEQGFLANLRKADGELGKLHATIEKIKTANEDASRNAEFEGLYKKVNDLYVALDKEAGDSCVKEVLQARWVEYYKEKDPKGKAIRGLKGRCMDIQATADKHVKAAEASTANLKAYNAVQKLIDDLKFVTADGKGSIAVARDQITNGVVVPGKKEKQAITGDAQTFYLAEITKFEKNFNDLKTQIDASYGEGKREMVAKQASYEKSLKDLSANLNNLPGQARVNEVAHNSLVKKSDAIETKLNEVITYVSENDKTSQRDKYLQQLTGQQKALIDEDKLIEDEWAKGLLGANESKRDGEYNAINKQILSIEATQKGEYSAVVEAENQAYFDKFQAKYNEALGVHKVAVSKIEKYYNLNHKDLQDAIWEHAKANEVAIYDAMQKAKDLKAAFEDAYAKKDPTLVFEFPEETSFNTLSMYSVEVQKSTDKLQKDATEDAQAFLKTKTDDAQQQLNGAQQDLKDKNFATWESAFSDVKANIKAANDFKVKDNEDYTIVLDALQGENDIIRNLDYTYWNIINGKETAADVEWAYFLKHDKVDLKADLGNWKGEIGYYNSKNGVYTDGTFVYPENESSQKRQDQRDFSAQYDIFDSYVNSYVRYNNVVSHKENANQAYVAAKAVYDRAASLVQQREKSDAAYELLFNGVSGKNKFDNNFKRLDAQKVDLDVFAGAYGVSQQGEYQDDWQYAMRQFEDGYAYQGLKSEIESAKKSGTVHNQLDSYKNQLNGYADQLDKSQVAVTSLYKYADGLQEKQLEADLETLKKELNRAVANSTHTIDFYDTIREQLVQYRTDLDNAKKLAVYVAKTNATPKHDAFVKLEGQIAATLQEVRASYEIDNDFDSFNESVNVAISSLMNDYNRLNELVESPETHEPVQKQYKGARDHAKQVLDEMNAYVDAHRAADKKVLYYYRNSVNQAIQKGNDLNLSWTVYSLQSDERAYDQHEARYAVVSDELTKYETFFNETVVPEISGYQHNKKDIYKKDVEAIQKAVKAERTFLDNHKVGNNPYVFNGRGIDNEIKSDMADLQKKAAVAEYDYLFGKHAMNAGKVVVLDVNPNVLLTPEDEKEYKALTDSLQQAYKNMDVYHGQLQSNYVYVNIDGKSVVDAYGRPMYKPYVVLDAETTAQNYQEVHKKVAELNAKVEQLQENLKNNEIKRGDLDNDNQVIANDYMNVLNYILEDKDFMAMLPTEQRALDRFKMRADANADLAVNIGDVVYVNNAVRGVNQTRKMLFAQPLSLQARQIDNIALSAEGEGTTRRIAISLNNSINYVGCQMDITLPAGVTLVGESVGDRASSHSLFSNDLDNGVHRIVVASADNVVFDGAEGAVVYLDVEVSHNYKGDGVIVSNVQFSDPGSQVYYLNSISGGEATGIGTVTLTEELKSKVYNVGGQLMNGLKKGVNIIMMKDGSVKKVIKK